MFKTEKVNFPQNQPKTNKRTVRRLIETNNLTFIKPNNEKLEIFRVKTGTLISIEKRYPYKN